MSLIEVVTLFTMMAALAALPSASVALVVTRAATLGVKSGIAVAMGIVCGDLVFVALAILGLSVVAETMGGFFILVKVLGGMYLIWLGISLWCSNNEPVDIATCSTSNAKRGLTTSFVSGFVLTLGDVKAIFFYASLLPMFEDLSTLEVFDLITIVSIIVLGVGGVKILYAVFATNVALFLERRKLQKVSKKVAGGFMIGAGSYLILRT
ncbi:LysE family translocator [Leptolyngbyaceae cyanobacterium CCMR0082]|uniref:LysE family translocator n=2 Tax=Adonisia TaxID=2950183 RepID=A0A6M0SEK8_9CYAN|nr:LysE family translocator [Adonisia turfae CCMR0082]